MRELGRMGDEEESMLLIVSTSALDTTPEHSLVEPGRAARREREWARHCKTELR
jgi:hypothetical protein